MTPAPVRRLYVYWTTAAPGAAAAAARAMQERLIARVPGLQAELLRREGDNPPAATLMEIYHHPDGIGAAVQAQIDRAAETELSPYRTGQRHTEVFHPL